MSQVGLLVHGKVGWRNTGKGFRSVASVQENTGGWIGVVRIISYVGADRTGGIFTEFYKISHKVVGVLRHIGIVTEFGKIQTV